MLGAAEHGICLFQGAPHRLIRDPNAGVFRQVDQAL
jgi:hypothetical protein